MTAEDVTAEHETRTRLQQSAERLESALSSAGVGIWDWNVATGEVCFSATWAGLRGYAPEELAPFAETWADGLHPDDKDRVVAAVDRNLRRETHAYVSEHRVRTKSGDWRWIHDRGRVVARDAAGRPLRMTGSELDVTERKMAEAALIDSERRLATLISNLPGAVVRCRNEPDWPVEFISEGIDALSGYTVAEMLAGQSLAELIHPEDRSYVWEEVQKALGERRAYRLEYRVRHRDGRELWWWEQGRGVFEAAGELRAIEAFVTDITERKEAEAARQHLEAQLRQSQKLEAVGQLSGGIAHDFNNLLSVVMGHVGLLGMEPSLTPEALNSITQINTSACRAATLTKQLLAFSRRNQLEPTTLDLNVVAQESLTLLRPLLGETIAVEFVPAPQPLIVRADRVALEQVIMNLALNGRDAMPAGGTLSIVTFAHSPAATTRDQPSAGKQGITAVLRVRDTGCGIPAANLTRIFEPFFTTKEIGRGTGLGLAIAYGIVRQHDGWIEVQSTVGAGTVFDIHLPRRRGTPCGSDTANAPLLEVTTTTHGAGVLLVEDEEPVRAILGVVLRRAGYTVHEAASGAAALALWRQRGDKIRVLVTDMIMPGGVSGRQLALELRNERPDLPVIYMSGYSPDIHGGEMQLQAGVNFAAKPTDLRLLAGMIERQLRT